LATGAYTSNNFFYKPGEKETVAEGKANFDGALDCADTTLAALVATTSVRTFGGVMISTAGDTANGAWRWMVTGNNTVLQRYDSSTWTTKFTITV